MFEFIPPSSTLKKMLKSSKFCALLDQEMDYHKTRSRADVIEDIKDGRVWKTFEATNFFKDRYIILFIVP